MNRKELVDAVSNKSGLTKKDAESFLNSFIETITHELKNGGSVSLVGFGSFKVNTRAAREGRNPQTGEKVRISARKVPSFKAGNDLKKALN